MASVRHTSEAVCFVELWVQRRWWLVRERGTRGTGTRVDGESSGGSTGTGVDGESSGGRIGTGVDGESSGGRTRMGRGGGWLESVGHVVWHAVASAGGFGGWGHWVGGGGKRCPALFHRQPRVQL